MKRDLLGGLRQLRSGRLRLAPQFLEVVIIADGGLHDMHQHFAQIHQNPLAAFLAFSAMDFFATLLELDHHVVGKRLGLPG